MPFTLQQIENVSNATLDLHLDRGKIFSQHIQDKPLLTEMRKRAKSFPGGKDYLDVRVKGDTTTTIQGFEYDDTVGYSNPANIKKAYFPYALIHAGIEFTKHELIQNGIRIVDSTNGRRTAVASEAEKIQLANLLDDKLDDMKEGVDSGMNDTYWRDGTQDSKLFAGIKSIIVDDPTAATVVGGIDQSASAWWRNRASLAINATSANAADNNLVQTMQTENRQLRRYGNPTHIRLCGSDFLEQLERELRAKGTYTDSGWANSGGLEVSMDDVQFKGEKFMYDPTLDDLGEAKRCYVIDTKNIYPMVVEGEDMQRHAPSRPEDKYVFYRAVTWVGGLVARMRRTSGVYAIA